MITGLVVALPEELATLTAQRIAKGQCVFISDTVLVTYAGTGANNATAGAELLIRKGATQLISWGCAAALSPSLTQGDLTLADTLLSSEGIEIAVDAHWHSASKQLLSHTLTVYTGCLAESQHIVASSRDKQQRYADTGAIALDMESVAIAKVAVQHALPFLALRVIVDPVTMTLPSAITHALNAQGDIVMHKLLGFLLLHPSQIMGLIKLGLQFKAATTTLKCIAKQLDNLTCTA